MWRICQVEHSHYRRCRTQTAPSLYLSVQKIPGQSIAGTHFSSGHVTLYMRPAWARPVRDPEITAVTLRRYSFVLFHWPTLELPPTSASNNLSSEGDEMKKTFKTWLCSANQSICTDRSLIVGNLWLHTRPLIAVKSHQLRLCNFSTLESEGLGRLIQLN